LARNNPLTTLNTLTMPYFTQEQIIHQQLIESQRPDFVPPPDNHLYKFCQKAKWEEARSYIRGLPGPFVKTQLFYRPPGTNTGGMSCIHIACARGAPVALLEKMLERGLEVENRSVLQQTAFSMLLPLHFFAASCLATDIEVLKFVIREFPKALITRVTDKSDFVDDDLNSDDTLEYLDDENNLGETGRRIRRGELALDRAGNYQKQRDNQKEILDLFIACTKAMRARDRTALANLVGLSRRQRESIRLRIAFLCSFKAVRREIDGETNARRAAWIVNKLGRGTRQEELNDELNLTGVLERNGKRVKLTSGRQRDVVPGFKPKQLNARLAFDYYERNNDVWSMILCYL
jgi:hypothetical protein